MFEKFRKRCSMLPISLNSPLNFFPEFSRYDVHVTSGGLALTHSMDFISNLAFKAQASHCWHCIRCGHFGQILCWRFVKAYLAVPFVEEMRVLTDWTITRSYQLGFFMHIEQKKVLSIFKQKSVWDKKNIQQKASLAYIVAKFEKCFLFLKVWLMDLKSVETSGHPWIFSCGWSWRTFSRRFFSAMWIHFI